MVAERLFRDRVFGFAVAVQEPCGEVVAEVADLHLSITPGVDHKLLFGDELAGSPEVPALFHPPFWLEFTDKYSPSAKIKYS